MIHIEYDPYSLIATSIADGRAVDFVNNLIAEHRIKGVSRVRVSSVIVVDELRLRVARGELPHSEIVIVYGHGTKIKLNKYGVYESGLLPDIAGDLSANIIRMASAARTEERRELRAAAQARVDARADDYEPKRASAEERAEREKWLSEDLTPVLTKP